MYVTVKYAGSGKKITIYDLAEIAGVSHTCVSRALLDRYDISPETKEEIRNLAEKYNYQPNEIARNLVLRKTSTVGVVISAFEDPTTMESLQCFLEELRKKNYAMMLFISNAGSPGNEMNLLTRKRIDGLVLQPGASESDRSMCRRLKNLPIVFYGNSSPMKNCVTVDRAKGTYDAVKYLIGMGHRDFAYLCYPTIDIGMNAHSKLTGFKRALTENGIVFRREQVVLGIGTLEDGYDRTKRLLKKGRIPGAILYNNDLSAMGGLVALSESGTGVPDDVSVVGFDNIAISRFTIPSLTTIEKPIREMTENAVKMLMRKMENPDTDCEQVTLTQNLIIRDSTGPAKRAGRKSVALTNRRIRSEIATPRRTGLAMTTNVGLAKGGDETEKKK